MRRFLRAPVLTAAVLLTAAPAAALMIRMPSPVERAVTADVVIVGKVTAIEKDSVEAVPFPGAPNKATFKVAVVRVESALAGAGNLTHLKVGFTPPPPMPAPNAPAPPGVARPAIRRPGGFQPVELKEGQELLLFLARHPDGAFYVVPPMNPPVEVKDGAGKKELEAVKKAVGVLADPAKALKAEKAEDRTFAATVLLTKYRRVPPLVRETEQVPVAAEESRLILEALAAAEWGDVVPGSLSPLQAFYSLGLGQAEGWTPPRVQPGENYPAAMRAAFVRWLDGPGKDYRVKKYVAKQK